jgi:hypothetical protein
MPRRAARGVLTLAVTAAVIGPSVSAATAIPRPTGNAAAIGFERAQQRAYDHVPAVRVLQRGLAVISAKNGPAPFVGLYFAGFDIASGWTVANETQTIALKRNRIVWAQDILAPVGHTRNLPVRIILDRAGAFWQPLDAGVRFPCFLPYYGDQPFTVGDQFQIVTGQFLAPTRAGNHIVITNVGAFGLDQTQTYIETSSRTSKLELSATVHVSKGRLFKEPAFTYTQTLMNLARAPREPQTELCPS